MKQVQHERKQEAFSWRLLKLRDVDLTSRNSLNVNVTHQIKPNGAFTQRGRERERRRERGGERERGREERETERDRHRHTHRHRSRHEYAIWFFVLSQGNPHPTTWFVGCSAFTLKLIFHCLTCLKLPLSHCPLLAACWISFALNIRSKPLQCNIGTMRKLKLKAKTKYKERKKTNKQKIKS